MSSRTALNIVLATIVAGLLGTLILLEVTEDDPPPPTTTTTTTTTLPPTTTTTTTTLPPTTTEAPTTTTTQVPTPTTVEPPVERFFTGVLVVNGTTAGERLAPVTQSLRDRGYTDTRGVVGATQAAETTIYFVGPYAGEAIRVAADLGFAEGDVAILPVSEAPPVPGVGSAKVIVYLGPGVLPEPAPIPG
jgi:hypothetical protein